jgi:pre-mRNA-splicing factor ISY1
MARNQEKAQSMLFRFRESANAEHGVVSVYTQRRPRLTSMTNNVREAEKWRFQAMQEGGRMIAQIMNSTPLNMV